MVLPDYLPIADSNNVKFFENYWNCEIDPDPGLTVVEIMESIYNKNMTKRIFVEAVAKTSIE